MTDAPCPRGGVPCRSILYVPGHRREWLIAAQDMGADALLYDLEDSVPLDHKASARRNVHEVLHRRRDSAPLQFVRINPWRSGLILDDLDSVVSSGLDGIFLAKVQGPADIYSLDSVLGELESARQIAAQTIEISPVCETPSGIYRHYEICMASNRIRRTGNVGLAASGDLTRGLGLEYSSTDADEGLYFNVRSGLEARAAGISNIIGGMTDHIRDLDLVARIAERAKRLGANGTTVLHPTHIPIVNEIFAPSPSEIKEARDIISSMAASAEAGNGAALHRGRMIDAAHERAAIETLGRARSWGRDVGDSLGQ